MERHAIIQVIKLIGVAKMKRLKQHYELVKPFDWIIVTLLMLASFIPIVIFTIQNSHVSADSEIVAVISINGKEERRITLSESTKHETFTLHPAKGQYNIIEVDGTRIRDKEDNSPDQVAVKTGWISKPGQTSVCLPHKMIIEIQTTEKTEEIDDTIIPL